MLNNRRKNEVLENINVLGGIDPQDFSGMERKYPKNYHPLIQYLYDIIFALKEMVNKDIPNAFPITEPRYKGSPYKHSDAEMFFAVPLETLEDANLAIELCLKLKESITAGRSVLANYYPKRLVMPTYQTQIQEDQLQEDIRTLDNFYDAVNKIQDKIMSKRQQMFHKNIDKVELERLRNHMIKIGFDILTSDKSLVELYPSILVTKEVPEEPYPNFRPSNMFSVHNSNIDQFVCDISDRLLEDLERDEKYG